MLQHIFQVMPTPGNPTKSLCGKTYYYEQHPFFRRMPVCQTCVRQGYVAVESTLVKVRRELMDAEKFAAVAGHTTYRLIELIMDTDDDTLKSRAGQISREGLEEADIAGEDAHVHVHHAQSFDDLPEEVKDGLMKFVTGFEADPEGDL